MFSKKLKYLTLLTATTLLFSGCSSSYESTINIPDGTNAIATFASDVSPLRMIQGGNTYYSFLGPFGGTSYTISASDDMITSNIIYEPSREAIVWFADANEDYLTWCETSAIGNTFYLYEEETNVVTELFACDNTGYQIKNVGIYKDCVYFANIDYEKLTAKIMCYDILNKTLDGIYTAEFSDNYAITSLSITDNLLTAVTNVKGKSTLVTINLDTMEKQNVVVVPKDAYFIFDAEYDSSTETYALYYISTKNKEIIGTYQNGAETISNIFTFPNRYFGYQDSITYVNGDIYWIIQANHKSITTTPERYALIHWDNETGEFFEYSRTYHMFLADDKVHYFSFDNELSYENVFLNVLD